MNERAKTRNRNMGVTAEIGTERSATIVMCEIPRDQRADARLRQGSADELQRLQQHDAGSAANRSSRRIPKLLRRRAFVADRRTRTLPGSISTTKRSARQLALHAGLCPQKPLVDRRKRHVSGCQEPGSRLLCDFIVKESRAATIWLPIILKVGLVADSDSYTLPEDRHHHRARGAPLKDGAAPSPAEAALRTGPCRKRS